MPKKLFPFCALCFFAILAFPAGPARARGTPDAASDRSSDPREVVDLSQGWRFRFGDVPDDVTRPGFDDSDWQRVTVPHTWNRIGEYALERSAKTNNEQGTGWYRLALDAPEAGPGMRQYLDFAAVSNVADVWVNGTHVGTHKGAFSRFRLDVTDAWKPGETNLIVVRADNSKPAPGSTTEDVIPLAGDFFVYGGIYRQAALLQLPDASIDPLDYGGPGVYAHATAITADHAAVDVLTRLRSQGTRPRKVVVTATIREAGGRDVASASSKLRLEPGASSSSQTLDVPEPHLWNGRADPYLYTVTVTLSDRDRVLDSVTQPLGLRSFRFDAEKGFFLDGKHLRLHGVSRHQDKLGKGWALTPEDHARDMALVEELGANSIRQAHYEHAQEWSDEADRAGMVVWSEVPYVAGPSLTGGKGSPALWANAEQQLRELIRQNYNHPSIVMWSIGNEVDSIGGFGGKGPPPQPLALLKDLDAIARQEDPDRPTTFADCCFGLDFKALAEGLGAKTEDVMDPGKEVLPGAADLIGYNRYFGWYYPHPFEARAMFGQHLDMLHARHPEIPMSVSEYGAGGAITQHSDDPTTGFVNFIGRPQPEEYQAWVHEQLWPVIAERDYVFGSWVWNMYDFGSDLRGEGDSVDLNTKGLVTYDRKVKKDAFYYYQAAWTDAPMIHLTGKRYVERSYPVMNVKAYTNAPRASLTLNGAEIGEEACANYTCVWKDVHLVPGDNRAEVRAIGAQGQESDSTVWKGPDPAHVGIRINAGEMATRTIAGHRFGSDTFVTGGRAMVLNIGSFGGRSAGPTRKVETAQPALFAYWREGGQFSYAVPVPNGKWTVTLHLFEPNTKPAANQALTVTANGAPAINRLNVAKAAGGPFREVTRSIPVSVTDGVLKLDFASRNGNAALAAIEITR